MTLERAIEVFVTAFSRGKSRTHPYIAERTEGLWVMQDGPGRKDPRKVEVITSGFEPADAAARVKRAGVGWHFLCDISPVDDPKAFQRTRAAFKELGYRAVGTEWMFTHDLQDIPRFESDPPVRLIETQEEADSIPRRATHKLTLLAGTRTFGIWDETRDYGYVRSVPVGENAWTSSLQVHEDVRRRGYGRALMSALLQSDKVNGVETNVLLATSAGSKLYPLLGYKQIAVLQMFCPKERY